MTFANNIHTYEGGMHEAGFKTALTRVVNDYAHKAKILKDKDDNLSGEDIREGITAVVSVKHPNPQFEGQTKTKLGNSDARTAVDRAFSETFSRFLMEILLLVVRLLKRVNLLKERELLLNELVKLHVRSQVLKLLTCQEN